MLDACETCLIVLMGERAKEARWGALRLKRVWRRRSQESALCLQVALGRLVLILLAYELGKFH